MYLKRDSLEVCIVFTMCMILHSTEPTETQKTQESRKEAWEVGGHQVFTLIQTWLLETRYYSENSELPFKIERKNISNNNCVS